MEIIYCACGCRKTLEKFDKYGRIRKYLLGHTGHKWKKGNIAWNKNIPCQEKTKRKISTKLKYRVSPRRGEKSNFWKGGTSLEIYGIEFNRKLKEQIRQRDSYRCQQCFRHQSELKKKLMIHHIDFNKKNNNPTNLISLCNNCHSQTNFNRENWITYFQNRMVENGNILP